MIRNTILRFFLLLLPLSLFFVSCHPADRAEALLTPEEQTWLDQHAGQITIAPDTSFAPFEFIDEKGQFRGIAAEYVKLIERKLGIRFNILRIDDWKENVEKAKRHEFDVWSAVVETPERDEYMLFTQPYIDIRPIFVVAADRTGEFVLTGNTTERVAVVAGYFLHEYLQNHFPKVPLLPVKDTLDGLTAVAGGRAAAMLTDSSTASYLMTRQALHNLKISGDPGITGKRLAFAVRKDWPTLQRILAKALLDIDKSEQEKILRTWIGLEAPDKPGTRGIALALVAVTSFIVVLLFLILLHRQRRKKEDKDQTLGQRPKAGLTGKEPTTVMFGLLLALALVLSLAALVLYMNESKKDEVLTESEKEWLDAHADQLAIAPDYNFAPVEFIDDNGHFRGIAADYVKQLEKILDCKFNIAVIEDWSENVRRVKNREFPIWSAVAPTAQKRQYMLFTRPYLEIQAALIVTQDRQEEFSLDNLGQQRIAVVKGYFTHDYLKKNYPEAQIVPVKNAAIGLRAVAFKEVDGMLIDIATASYLIEKEGFSNLKVASTFDLGYRLAFASRNDWPTLNRILDKGLARISQEKRQEIFDRWVHFGNVQAVDYHAIFVTIAVGGSTLALVLGGVLLWNRSLRRMVHSKTSNLAEREALLQSIFRSAPDGIGLVTDRSFDWCNRKIADITGYSTEELQGQSTRLLYFDDASYLEAGKRLYDLAAETDTGSLETRWRRKDGSAIDVLVSSSPVKPERQMPCYTITVLDITARKRAEAALLQSEEKYREIFNAPSEAIFVHDADSGRILDVNRSMLQMFGIDDYQQALASTVDDLSANTPPYSEKEAMAWLKRSVTHGPQLFVWHSRRKNGDLFWTEVALKFITLHDDRFILAVVRDIDKRRRAEEALAAEKERLAVTLRSIGDGVITTDIDGAIVMLNAVAEKLTGWSQREAEGKPISEVLRLIDTKTRRQDTNPVRQVLQSGAIVGQASHSLLIARDGSERSVTSSAAPIRDRQSKIIGVVLVFRDVSDKLKMEEELLKVRKLESVGVLAGGIAHDFNNLLAAILGNIDLARHLLPEGEKAATLLQNAEKASFRAKDLTQQLLTFSKGGEPITETASIGEVISESAEFILHGGNVACSYDMQEDLWLVEIDRGQMSQVIQNLILNSKQAMADGGRISIVCRNVEDISGLHLPLPADRKYIRITISDTGAGISADILSRIFDPYFSTRKDGSGLGLAVAHSIITNHHGHISVESAPDTGTAFTILLPASAGKMAPPQPASQPPSEGKGRIMVMDDEEMVREITANMLHHLGYEVVTTASGEETIERYRQLQAASQTVDAVIMDLTIPGGMGGKEAVRLLHDIDPEARVLVASGYSNDPVLAQFRDFGFSATLIKPYRLHDLQQTLQLVLTPKAEAGEVPGSA